MSGRLPLVLDVDTGIDDSLALLYACASPDAELVAVTCVAGNVLLDAVVDNTLAVLELAGRTDVPVHAGAAAPLVKPLVTTEETHGPRGIGHARLAVPAREPASDDAAGAIVRLARDRPGEIRLVTLGPVTNLARALALEPRLPAQLRGWTMMGGAFGVPGNTTPTSEWNVHVDPDALAACLAGWSRDAPSAGGAPGRPHPIAMGAPGRPHPMAMGLDVTERARLLPEHVAAISRRAGAAPADAAVLEAPDSLMLARGSVAANPVLRFVVDALRFYFEFHAANDGFYGAFIHDPFVVAATLDPHLVRTRPLAVEVEVGPGLGHAMTVADWRGAWSREPNADVAVEADPVAFLERLVDRVGSLAATRGAVTAPD
ncbi:MAG: nucleoside hydrolase [Chloroflexi bacterium]|nr:nucleoside hydrolase [Chloroflexota bacterium]